MSLIQQAALSVLGTLAATAILAGLKAEWTVRPAAPPAGPASTPAPPPLTSGGKFAARVSAGDGPDTSVSLLALPPVLPMFTAPAVPALDLRPVRVDLADAVAADAPQPAAPRPPRTTAVHRDARRTAPASPWPTARTSAGTIAMAPLPVLTDDRSDSPSLWSHSGAVYRQMASWSDRLIDHLIP